MGRRVVAVVTAALEGLVGEFGIAPIVNTNRLENAEMGKRERLAGALLVEAVATIAAVVLPVGKSEGGPTAHANIRVDPLGGLGQGQHLDSRPLDGGTTNRTAVDHAARDTNTRRELVAVALECSVHLVDI